MVIGGRPRSRFMVIAQKTVETEKTRSERSPFTAVSCGWGDERQVDRSLRFFEYIYRVIYPMTYKLLEFSKKTT